MHRLTPALLVAAVAAAGCSQKPSRPELAAPSEPTYVAWERVTASLQEPTREVERAMDDVLSDRWQRDSPELVSYLDASKGTIDAFLEATRTEHTYAAGLHIARPGGPGDKGVTTPEVGGDLGLGLGTAHSLNRLVLVQAQRLASEGHRNEALEHVLASLRFSLQHFRAEDSVLITFVIGHSLNRSALEQLRELIGRSRIRPDAWREALDELQRMRAAWTDFDAVYRNDRRQMLAICEQSFQAQGIGDSEQVRLATERYRELDATFTDLFARAWRECDASIIEEPMAELERELEEFNSLPATPEALAALAGPEKVADVTAKLVLHISLSKLATAIETDLIARVEFDMACVGIAARLYMADHGDFPQRLELLVPDYLDALPEDPFDRGRPVKLQRGEGRWWPYSVGPDRVDQEGLVQWIRSRPERGGDILSGARPHRGHQ